MVCIKVRQFQGLTSLVMLFSCCHYTLCLCIVENGQKKPLLTFSVFLQVQHTDRASFIYGKSTMALHNLISSISGPVQHTIFLLALEKYIMILCL